MSIQTFKNQFSTTLASGVSSSATTIPVAAGTGSLIPALTGGAVFTVIITDAASQTLFEEVVVTAVSGDNLTVIRAQEGSTGKSWLAGDKIYQSWTAAMAAGVAQGSQIQSMQFSYAVDTGTASNYIINPQPTITAISNGMSFDFIAANTNAASPTITVGSAASKPVYDLGGNPLVAGMIVAGSRVRVAYSQSFSRFVVLWAENSPIIAPSGTSATYAASLGAVQGGATNYAVASGSSTAYTLSPVPAVTSYADGAVFRFKSVNANGASPTLQVGSAAALPIVSTDGVALASGQAIAVGSYVTVIYSAAINKFILQSATGMPSYGIPATLSTQNATLAQINAQSVLDIASMQSGAPNYAVCGGTAGAVTLTLSPAPTSQPNGMRVTFVASTNVNAGATVSVNGGAALPIANYDGTFVQSYQLIQYCTYTLVKTTAASATYWVIESSGGEASAGGVWTTVSRSSGTVYYNSNHRAIQVAISGSGNAQINMDLNTPPTAVSVTIPGPSYLFTVPARNFYKVVVSGLTGWLECY